MKFNVFFVLIVFLVMIIPISLAHTNAQSEETLLTIPDTPTNLIAVTNLPINLSWTASPDPSSQAPVTHYSIERSNNGGETWDVISLRIEITKPYSHVKAETITYTDSNVVIGNIYDYRVKAHNIVGESVPSITANATAILPVDNFENFPTAGIIIAAANGRIQISQTFISLTGIPKKSYAII